MQLCVSFEGCHRSTLWTAKSSAASAVSALLADLCREFGLSSISTQLWQADVELRPEQELHAVRSSSEVGVTTQYICILFSHQLSGSQKLSAVDLSGLDSGSLLVTSALKRLKLDLCSIACLTTDAKATVAQWKDIVHPQRTIQMQRRAFNWAWFWPSSTQVA
ncbi:hypothetical protein WJX79_001336 [Trebouxia sp. C0005]